jgi:type I restriction enzyme S subunit
MKGIPEIRFNKYSEDWIQDRFSDLTYPAGVKNRDNLDLPSYSITNDHGFVRQDVKFENGGTMKDADKSMYYIVSPHSFAYNPARINVGSIGYQDLDHNVIISSLYEIFKVSGPVVDKFLWWWFKTKAFKTQVKKLQEGGVRLYFFYDKLCKSILQYPKSKQEQTAIGKFFDDLDEYISSQALELQKLKNIKKACLEKMFPKEGELVPEIRFDGFEGNWEKKPAKKLFGLYSDKGYPSLPVLSASQEEGMILRNDVGFNMSYNKENIISYKRVRPGQFVIHLRSFQGGFAHSDLEGITSPAYTIFGLRDVDNHDDHFWGIYFTSKSFIKRLEKVTYGIRDGRSISVDGFMNLDMTYPSTKEEQSNIAKFFSRLDVHIKAMSDKLDKLKQIRKGLLEKMFVANN